MGKAGRRKEIVGEEFGGTLFGYVWIRWRVSESD